MDAKSIESKFKPLGLTPVSTTHELLLQFALLNLSSPNGNMLPCFECNLIYLTNPSILGSIGFPRLVL